LTVIVDAYGNFDIGAHSHLHGLDVFKEGTDRVLQDLTVSHSLIQSANYVHRYPYDWRTGKPILIRTTPQWFVDVKSLRAELLESLDHVDIDASGISHISTIRCAEARYLKGDEG